MDKKIIEECIQYGTIYVEMLKTILNALPGCVDKHVNVKNNIWKNILQTDTNAYF